MANIFPMHDNGDPYTSEELAQARETMGRKLLTTACLLYTSPSPRDS